MTDFESMTMNEMVVSSATKYEKRTSIFKQLNIKQRSDMVSRLFEASTRYRLQNLPSAATSVDVRQYFQGLSIPDGGVHIFGGDKGVAFILFSTNEDARQAMQRDGGYIKEVQIRLLLSSQDEMQTFFENTRQQSLPVLQVYMQQMQQPQLPIIGSLPPLTTEVLPLFQQQVRSDHPVNILHTHQPILDPSTNIMIQEKQQHLLSPSSSENKDCGDNKSDKRKQIRSKLRNQRSKSSRNNGGSRRDRSRSKDRSRGRDRSRDRHHGGSGRDSLSQENGGKSRRFRSLSNKPMNGDKAMVGDQQTSIWPWICQYDNFQQQMRTDNHQSTSVMNIGGGPLGSMFMTPPQPPIISILNPNPYQQQQQLLRKLPNSEWTVMGGDKCQQQPYVPDNNFQGNGYDEDSNDEDDRHPKFDNNFHKIFNNTSSALAIKKFPVQDFHHQQGYGLNNKDSRFNKPPQGIGAQNNRSDGHQSLNYFGGSGRPRFNNHQQQPMYGGRSRGNVGYPQNSVVRQSRFSSIHENGRPSRFNSMPQKKNDRASDPNFDDDSKKLPLRYNDQYIRNTQPLIQGLCVEVNNMSNHFSYGDIRKVFKGIHFDGSTIKIQRHQQGVAFVRFDNNHSKNLALRVNGTKYKGSRIVIKHLDDRAYEQENTDDHPYPSKVAAPTNVDHVDLVDDDEQLIANDNKQNNKQEDSHKDDDCNLVVCAKNVKDGGKTECGEQLSTASQQEQPTKYLKLIQLPITMTKQDVLNKIDGGDDVQRVIFYPDGEFWGVVLEFQSVDAAEATLKRFNSILLGSAPVPLLRCTYNEFTFIKRKIGGEGRRFTSSDTGSHYHHHNQHHLPSTSRSSTTVSLQPPSPSSLLPVLWSNCVYMYNLPTTVTNIDITQFFADTSAFPNKIHIMLSKFARPTGKSYCEFNTVQEAHAALAKDQCFMGPNMVYVKLIGRSEMIQAIMKVILHPNHHQNISWREGICGGGGGPPRLHFGSFGGHNGPYRNRPQHHFMNIDEDHDGGYTPRIHGPRSGPNTGPDGFGQPGCVVALENVPYWAHAQVIVDFFKGFELNAQNVIQRLNDYGNPTGEVYVNLQTPQEAMRAVRVLHNKAIYNRPVRLMLL